MEVRKLQARIQDYKAFLMKDRNLAEVYKWEALLHFQQHWDIEAIDFAKMYDASFQSTTTQRLWKREIWRPKELMLLLIGQDPEFARKSFRNLFDDTQNIDTRVSMFKFACDEMLSEYKRQHKTSIENNHYHDDLEMIFLYLTFRFPEQFTFFEYPPFSETLRQMGIQDIPTPYNLDRFLKLTKILYTFLKKDEELIKIHQTRFSSEQLYKNGQKLLVHDFYAFCGKRK